MFNDDLFTLLDTNAADSRMNGNAPSNASDTNNTDLSKEGEQKDSDSWIEDDAKAWKVAVDTKAAARPSIPPVVFPTIVNLPPAPAKACSNPSPPPAAAKIDKPTAILHHAVSNEAATSSAPAIFPQHNMSQFEAVAAPISPQPPVLPPLQPDPDEEEEEDDAAFLLRTKNEFAEWIQNAYR